jgi:signal transduction histidine kinase
VRDPDRVAQVLWTIATAVAHAAAGHIAVEAQSIERGWRISITDTGEGIAPERSAARSIALPRR